MGVIERALPPHTEEEYAALKADISARGVQIPVEVDGGGQILDGHARWQACAELGVECPTVTRSFSSDDEKLEHVIKLNLIRRQLGPLSWAAAFRRYCEMRGVATGQGARNDLQDGGDTSDSLAEVAAELGVSERTARRRCAAADLLGGHADLYSDADAGHLTLEGAGREARRREERQRDKKLNERLNERDKEIKAKSRFAHSPLERVSRSVGILSGASSTAVPLMLTASHTYASECPDELVRFGVSEYPVPRAGGGKPVRCEPREPRFDGSELVYLGSEVPLLSPADDAVISAMALKLDYVWFPDPEVTQATTRPMEWAGDKLLLPTGRWEGVEYGAAVRRWWVWDYIDPREGRLIRKLGNSAVFPVRLLETVRQAKLNDYDWVACEYLEDALEEDLAAVRAHREDRRDLDDPASIYEMGEAAAPERLGEHPGWQRFAAYVRNGGKLEAAPLEPRQHERLFAA